MSAVEPIKNISDIRKIEDILSKESERDLIIFTLGTNCGLRISDILALDVRDVKNKTHIRIIEKKTKKNKIFPINTKLKPMLEKFILGKKPEEPLFKTIYGNRLHRVTAYMIFNKVCQKAGLYEKIGTHTLRKTFGYHHYKKFKDIAILQKIFNHSSPLITLRYIGIEQDEIEASYNNFILWFNHPKKY